jgi:uncharacterized protein (DUF433 family)
MSKEYVEQRDGGYFVAGTRVSLDSVVYAFLRGESPEGIADSYPALTLEEVFGALSFYLANRESIDQYLSEGRQEFDRLREDSRGANPALYAKLLEARRGPHSPRG